MSVMPGETIYQPVTAPAVGQWVRLLTQSEVAVRQLTGKLPWEDSPHHGQVGRIVRVAVSEWEEDLVEVQFADGALEQLSYKMLAMAPAPVPVSTPKNNTPTAKASASTSPIDTAFPDAFTAGNIRFVQDRSGRNEKQHSAARHCDEYLKTAPTQQLRSIMYNNPVYSLEQYVERYRAACVAVVQQRSFGQPVTVLDDNNRPWTVIVEAPLVAGSGIYRVKHAHFENYQNWQPL